MPNGIPKFVRCYDNGGETFDRFMVIFSKKKIGDEFMYLGMSSDPTHPQGFGQHGFTKFQPADRPAYSHLGKKIKFEDLPEDCQKVVISNYLQLWDFKNEWNKWIE